MAHFCQDIRGLLVTAGAALLLSWSPTPAAAQSASSSGTFQAPSNPDFMLGRPRASVGVRGGWMVASAKSDIFDFVTEQLTLEKSSFNTPGFGADVSISLKPRLDLVAGIDLSKSTTPSEYRAFVDNRNLPIQQETSLLQTSMFAAVKFAIVPRGRAISRFAWIPAAFVPYVGAGGGVTNYDFKQVGDFVDFSDNRVFTDTFRSHGFAPTALVFAGADIQVYRRISMSIDGRYAWAKAKLSADFIDFEPMDLGGFRFGAGFRYSF